MSTLCKAVLLHFSAGFLSYENESEREREGTGEETAVHSCYSILMDGP